LARLTQDNKAIVMQEGSVNSYAMEIKQLEDGVDNIRAELTHI